MFSMVFEMMKGIFGFFKIPLIILIGAYLLFYFSEIFWLFYYRKKGWRMAESSAAKKKKKRSWVLRLFVDAPRQIIVDKYNREQNEFQEYGLIIFTGYQGSGKTSSMVKYILDLKEKYVDAKITTNFGLSCENMILDDWRKLTDFVNGKQGVICALDELQNWFNSKNSKNFPAEMLSVVTQNRKNRRVLLGTAQNFYMISKDIRSQTREIRKCMTLFGCITIVHRVQPIINGDGDIEKLRHIGFYWFVHDERLRSSYDTYKVIENLSKADFKEKTVKLIES